MISSSLSLKGFSSPADTPFRRFVHHFDWILFLDVLLLCAIGLTMVYSASLRFGNPEMYLGKQLTAFLIGMGFLFILATLNYQIFSQYPRALFLFSSSLLALVLVVGNTYHATKAWFKLGPIFFQPSEIAKIIVILLLGIWCDKHARDMKQIRTLGVPFFIVFSHVGLILLQPDFGSTMVYFPILVGMLYVAGAEALHILVIVVYAFVAAFVLLVNTFLSLSPMLLENPFWNYIHRGTVVGKEFMILLLGLGGIFSLAWYFTKQLRMRIPGFYFLFTFLIIGCGWFSSSIILRSMKHYQKKRLNVLFSPAIDPMGAGYHVIQSEVALGSGKIFGRGLFSGTQGRLGFLPEQHTDFIFSVLGEELGFLMSAFVLLLYLILLWRTIAIAGDARDRLGSLVAVGIACMFAFYTFLNLAMVMGLAPVTGLPLPFLSYGGSSMVSSLAAVGILLSIHVRRYTH